MITSETKELVDTLASSDDKERMNALQTILMLTDQKVDWVYDAWDELLEKLKSENSFQRSIGIMVICNLAKSDTQNRLISTLELLLAHTRDEKFITSRQCLQSIWKVAITSPSAREEILSHLEKQFTECKNEKHYNLIRSDIIQSMRCIYDATLDEALLARMKALIAQETEAKYQKKLVDFLK